MDTPVNRMRPIHPEFWMGLQADYEMARVRAGLAAELATIRPRNTAEPA